MAKDPAFLFYSQDFFTGTATMSFEDKGKYIHLLCLLHQKGRMNEETIRFCVGSISDSLRAKFRIDENGLWFNERLESESEKRKKFTESRKNNGNKGGRPKKEKPLGYPTDNLTEDVNEVEDVNENSHSVFALRLLSKESEYDKEQIEVSTKVQLTEELLKQFNANLHNSNVRHYHFSEYKRHLVNWIPKKPKEETSRTCYKKNQKPTAMDYMEVSRLAIQDIKQDE